MATTRKRVIISAMQSNRIESNRTGRKRKNDRLLEGQRWRNSFSRHWKKNENKEKEERSEIFFFFFSRGETRKHPGETAGYSLNFDLICRNVFELTPLPSAASF